jgi:hypothetical protein
MHVLRIEHDVADYDAWKSVFDGDPLGRAQSGVVGHRILRVAGDPVRVLIDLEFADAGAAEAFQARLRELWGRVDVMQNPTSQIGEVVEASEY